MSTSSIYRKGFGLTRDIAPELERDYDSGLVRWFRDNDYKLERGDTTILLAREFGFCYGVDRAVEYAYETRRQFPDRTLHITGEIIHNPHVNANLRRMNIHFLSSPDDLAVDFSPVEAGDVVILPAFGARAADMETLRERGAVVVDTTCGSVLNVWKQVQRNARDGFTSVIHGKYAHEETRATASWARGRDGGGHYLIVRDMEEAEVVCGFVENGGDSQALRSRFAAACSDGFDPASHLQKVGVANQTTMLSSESLAIARRLEKALTRRWGKSSLAERFRTFDTICSATQERQDAVIDLLQERLDTLVVIGGFNSSNTAHLAELAERSGVPPYHIESPEALLADGSVRYRPVDGGAEQVQATWLPDGPVRIGVTAGASTPNNRIGQVLNRLLELRGIEPPALEA